MARPVASDYLQNHRFGLLETTGSLDNDARPVFRERAGQTQSDGLIGFQAINLPPATSETFEVPEGTSPFVHTLLKGRATSGEVELSLAVLPNGTIDFYHWFTTALYGYGVPRRNFTVFHKARSGDDTVAQRLYVLEGCIPIVWQPPSLSADDDGISIETLTMHVHHIRLAIKPIQNLQANIADLIPTL